MSLIELDTRVSDELVWTPAGDVVIASQAQYVSVAERRKSGHAFVKRVQEFFAPLKKKADDAHKAASVCSTVLASLENLAAN